MDQYPIIYESIIFIIVLYYNLHYNEHVILWIHKLSWYFMSCGLKP